jgi:hypothetical protein
MRLPFSSSGLRIPLFAETKMHECLKKREGKTGMAMKGGFSEPREAVTQHPEKRLFHRLIQVDEVDAVSSDRAVDQRTRAVVIPAGEGEA